MSSAPSVAKKKRGRPKKVANAPPEEHTETPRTSRTKAASRKTTTATTTTAAAMSAKTTETASSTKRKSSAKADLGSPPCIAPKTLVEQPVIVQSEKAGPSAPASAIAGSGPAKAASVAEPSPQRKTRPTSTLKPESKTQIQPDQTLSVAKGAPEGTAEAKIAAKKPETEATTTPAPRQPAGPPSSAILQAAAFPSFISRPKSTPESKPEPGPANTMANSETTTRSPASQLASSIASTHSRPLPRPKLASEIKAPSTSTVGGGSAGGIPISPNSTIGRGARIPPRIDVHSSKKYRSHARRWTATMVAIPILLCTSYALYQRVLSDPQLDQAEAMLNRLNRYRQAALPATSRSRTEQTAENKNTNKETGTNREQ